MENKRLFGKICSLHRRMSRENTKLFSDYGITPIQMQTLVFVHLNSENGKLICQKDIENHITLRASSVSTMLRTLEKSGLIERSFADGDARTKIVSLTEKGMGVCFKNKLLMEKCDALVQNALTEAEQAEFEKLLNKILTATEDYKKDV